MGLLRLSFVLSAVAISACGMKLNNPVTTKPPGTPVVTSTSVAAIAPVINVSASTADGVYIATNIIDVTVTFAENVTVNTGGGIPLLTLELGATDQVAAFASGSGTSTLVFSYTVPGQAQK